jgi:hypothetical protein
MPADYERDCPKCGESTTVEEPANTPLRMCDNDQCNWCVSISGGVRL